MEVYGNIRTKVEINPLEVLEKLYNDYCYWYTEENGKYYRNWEISAGTHSMDEKEVINKETYDYYTALKKVIDYVKLNKIK